MTILDYLAYDGQVPGKCVVFADILGFGALSEFPGAGGALDALSALSNLLSRNDTLGTLLNWNGWEGRYALSDSVFLVSSDLAGAIAATAELFFSLAYISHSGPSPVLMRGGISSGEVLEADSIFPSFAPTNLVGAAVVRAVRLEASPLKGPRLFIDELAAQELEKSESTTKWLLDSQGGYREVLWLLPPDPAKASGLLIGELCGKIIRLVQSYGGAPKIGAHYLGYLDLLVRSLSRLVAVQCEEAFIAIKSCGLQDAFQDLEALLLSPTELLVRQLRYLTDYSR